MNINYERNLFIFIVIVKIFSLFLFNSEVSSVLFQPFLRTFVGGELNPWQYYFLNSLNQDAFPYQGLMLFIHAFPAMINKFIVSGLLKSVIFKLPLFFSDIILYKTIKNIFPAAKKEVLIFYFINPIVFFAIYVHAQLDIIPTALLFYSIYALSKGRITFSSFILGLALATKFCKSSA